MPEIVLAGLKSSLVQLDGRLVRERAKPLSSSRRNVLSCHTFSRKQFRSLTFTCDQEGRGSSLLTRKAAMESMQAVQPDIKRMDVGREEMQTLLKTESDKSLGRHLSRRKVTHKGAGRKSREDYSFSEDVGHAASETLLITRLAFTLLQYLGLGYRWVTKFMALMLYAALLLPGFLQVGWYYYRSSRVQRSISYGCQPRNRLDLYLPEETSTAKSVVIFVTGGAWVIGYKAWGALLGQALAERGVMVACLDYRNFPQGGVSDMVSDVTTGIAWVFENIARYGGDASRIYVVGQSAGAHLSSVAILRQAMHAACDDATSLGWIPSQICAYFGVSGGYNLVELVEHFHNRGLYRSILHSVMEGEESLPAFSPELIAKGKAFESAVKFLPPMNLFHGTEDQSIPSLASKQFGDALAAAGANVNLKFYRGKSHTDPIIQDPMRGGRDELLEDILEIIHAGNKESELKDKTAPPRPRMVPEFLLQLAAYICPF